MPKYSKYYSETGEEGTAARARRTAKKVRKYVGGKTNDTVKAIRERNEKYKNLDWM